MDTGLLIARIVFGLVMAAHGSQKLFGWFGGYGLAGTGGFFDGDTIFYQGTLLIGFRNPIPDGKALIVPLDNPQQVVEGERAKLGPPIELALNGLGIRSIEYRESRGRYLIAAGPYNDDGKLALFGWSGKSSDAAELMPERTFGDLKPEAMFVYPGDTTAVQFLSDDGGMKLDGVECKKLPPAQQRFRGFSLDIP